MAQGSRATPETERIPEKDAAEHDTEEAEQGHAPARAAERCEEIVNADQHPGDADERDQHSKARQPPRLADDPAR